MAIEDPGSCNPAETVPGQEASCEDARLELDTVLSDPEFHCTERNKRFLRFVSEELFKGRAAAIKAYTIAVDVFGRPSSFDPATDPIVRIEATRLRASLMHYYDLHGRDHPVRIDLPKGRYIPVFLRANAPADAAVRMIAGPGMARFRPGTSTSWPSASLGLAGAILAGAALLGLSLLSGPDPETITERPKVSIQLLSADEPATGQGARLRDTLTAALSRFQTLRLAPTDASEDDRAATQARQAAPDPSGQYVVALKYSAGPAGQSVWWQVVDRANGEALRTGIEEMPKGARAGTDPLDAVVARLAMRLAGNKGIFDTVLTAAELKQPTLGNGCILRASLALESADAHELGVARSCLERTIALHPGDADAHAMLAVLLLKQLPSGASATSVEQASGLARQAVALAPDSATAVSAQMLTEFRSGDTEAAITTGRRAMELNPYDTAIAVRLGTILFLTGKWDAGLPLLRQVDEQEAGLPCCANAILAFDAYRRGQFDEALRRLQSANSGGYLSQLLQVATLAQLGRREEMARTIAALRKAHPEFERSFTSDMNSRRLTPALTNSLKAGLQRAGLAPQ